MSPQNLSRALAILAAAGANEVCAEHDRIFCGSEDLVLSDADRQELDDLGWFISEESWGTFT